VHRGIFVLPLAQKNASSSIRDASSRSVRGLGHESEYPLKERGEVELLAKSCFSPEPSTMTSDEESLNLGISERKVEKGVRTGRKKKISQNFVQKLGLRT